MPTKRDEFETRPDPIRIRVIGDTAHLTLTADIQEVEAEEGTTYTGETLYMDVPATPGLRERVEWAFELYVEEARRRTAAAERAAADEAARMTVDDVLEALLDQDVRLSMLEMGVIDE